MRHSTSLSVALQEGTGTINSPIVDSSAYQSLRDDLTYSRVGETSGVAQAVAAVDEVLKLRPSTN
jgi:hypothetical protein